MLVPFAWISLPWTSAGLGLSSPSDFSLRATSAESPSLVTLKGPSHRYSSCTLISCIGLITILPVFVIIPYLLSPNKAVRSVKTGTHLSYSPWHPQFQVHTWPMQRVEAQNSHPHNNYYKITCVTMGKGKICCHYGLQNHEDFPQNEFN